MIDSERDELQMPDDSGGPSRPLGWSDGLVREWPCSPSQGPTGTIYKIPVSYHQDGDEVTIVTKRARRWWHNFETPQEAVLLLAGRDYFGKAEVVTDMAAVGDFMMGYLEDRPIDAKAYGLAKEEITNKAIEGIIPGIVVIRAVVIPDR